MRRMKTNLMAQLAIAAALGSIATNSYAEVHVAYLTQVGAATNTYAVAIADKAATALPSCATSGVHMSFDKTTDHGKAMLSIALAALMANKPVRIVYDDAVCGLYGTRLLITRIDIQAG